jgi:hypothetical protein
MQTIEALRTEHGLILETDADILEALTGEGVDAATVLRRWVRSALDDKASAAAAKQRMVDLHARVERFDRHYEAKRATVIAIMEALELKAFRDPEFTLSLSAGKPKVIVTHPDHLPPEFIEVVTSLKPMNAEIKDALLRGEDVVGATLSNGGSVLTIRSK